MQPATLPDNELARLDMLRAYAVLDTPAEPSFDRLTALAAKLFQVPIAAISLVDADRQWSKSCIGIAPSQAPRDLSLCAHAILRVEPMVVPDTFADPRFADNPYIVGPPNVRFYAGAPLVAHGVHLGVLCVVDTVPRELDAGQRALLADLAALVVDELDARRAARAQFLLEKVSETTRNYFYLLQIDSREIVWSNRDIAVWLGYPPGALLDGRTRLGHVHPDDHAAVFASRERLLASPAADQTDIHYRMRDAAGAYRWFLSRERVFERDASGRATQIVGVMTDISDLKRAELELVESRRALAFRVSVLQNVLDTLAEGVIVADASGAVVEVNPAARRIAGLRPTNLPAAERPQRHGVFLPDGTTPFPADRLPLTLALAGQATEAVELVFDNPQIAAPTRTEASGRPLRDGDGAVVGGVVTFRDVTAAHAARTHLAELALTDPLTGLPNVRALRARLGQLVDEARHGRAFAAVMIDVDHFKHVNDQHGHDVGDQVLRALASTLKRGIRKLDFAARYGGEEFCVLYADVDATTAYSLAERLRRAVAAIDDPLAITCSIGVCAHAGDGDAMLRAADAALYRAKRAGRDRVMLCDEDQQIQPPASTRSPS